eukprot:m.338862 g.338862  ORF g.338862 m.338862 type:complete len:488 (+) comp18569_c0_seq1:84-1547(+)
MAAFKQLWLCVFVLLFAYDCHAQDATLRTSDTGELVLEIPEGTKAYVRSIDAAGNERDYSPIITKADLDAQIKSVTDMVDNLRADMISNISAINEVLENVAFDHELGALSRTVDANTALFESAAKQEQVDSIDASLKVVLDDITKISEKLNSTISSCPPLSDPSNGAVDITESSVPGTTATYSCNTGYKVKGSATSLCLISGVWESNMPTCEKQDEPGLKQFPGVSCRDLFTRRKAANYPLNSGKYYIKLGVLDPVEIFCDFDTSASPTDSSARGWTLCAKYDFEKTGARYLSAGFARAMSAPEALQDLGPYAGIDNQKWVSLDCRSLVKNGATHFMHVGFDDVLGTQPKYSAIRYTNIMDDVKKNPSALFDITLDDKGTCAGGSVVTYDESWKKLSIDRGGRLLAGSCLTGDGHSFCSYNRDGAKYSNAGADNCAGSGEDTIYWAWEDDDHGCNGGFVLGTGCDFNALNRNSPSTPTYRFNYLFVN